MQPKLTIWSSLNQTLKFTIWWNFNLNQGRPVRMRVGPSLSTILHVTISQTSLLLVTQPELFYMFSPHNPSKFLYQFTSFRRNSHFLRFRHFMCCIWRPRPLLTALCGVYWLFNHYSVCAQYSCIS
jgi:hypothetical protein